MMQDNTDFTKEITLNYFTQTDQHEPFLLLT